MKTKLTLSVDKDLVQYARRQADVTGQSISNLVSQVLAERKRQAETRSRPGVEAMTGTLKGYQIADSKRAIHEAYAQKYYR